MATEVKRRQIQDAVGSSWAALAAEEDPHGRGVGTLLSRREQDEKGGRAGRVGGAGVLNSKNNGRIR